MPTAVRSPDFAFCPEAAAHTTIPPRQTATTGIDPALSMKEWGIFPECYPASRDPTLETLQWGVFSENFR